MEAIGGVQNVVESSPDNGDVLQCFAQAVAEAIVHSATYECSSSCLSVQERLAEKLASLVMTASLQKVIGSSTRPYSFSVSIPSSDRSENALHSINHRDIHMDTEISEVGEKNQTNMSIIDYHSSPLHTFKNTQAFSSFLPTSGLPTVGSLDYPDAPPTTPLVPGNVQSRASFTRKLKGGLAKEFLPSPPPPTPKENERDEVLAVEGAVEDPREEFVGRLLRSLSLECSLREDLWKENEDLHSPTGTVADGEAINEMQDLEDKRSRLMAYVEAVSDDIVSWMNNNMTNIDNLCLLFDRLSEKIITLSLSEVRLRGYAERLVSSALSLARAELKAASLGNTQALQQKPQDIGDQEAPGDPALSPTLPNMSSAIQLCSPEPKEVDLDPSRCATDLPISAITQSYAEGLAGAVLKCCLIEVSKQQRM